TLVISAISVAIGITLANTIRPGERISEQTAAALEQRYGSDAAKRVEEAKKSGASNEAVALQVVKSIVPVNPITAVASETPNMLHLM
ncbi:hypothetical protein WAI88_21435, partial [Acinetobacter baumannii]